MKKILLIALIVAPLFVFSQDTTWSKSMLKVFGTKAEKVFQDQISHQSDNGYLCRYIGFKEYYCQHLSMFLQFRYDFTLDYSNTIPGRDVYILSKNGVYMNTNVPKIKTSFTIDKNHRITSGKISGSFLYLAYLFLTYWPQDATYQSIEQIKLNTIAVKHSYGDLISFKGDGLNAIITITKDPNLIVPVPDINAVNKKL